MPVLIDYKCPCCGGAIAFDSASQKLKCPYCDNEFDIDALKNYNEELKNENADDMNWQSSAGSSWAEGETDSLVVYICNSCGGEIVCDENTSATSCPFCGSPVVVTGKLSGLLKPDCIIPFKVDKNAAKAALQNHYCKKRLLPKVFKDSNHIDEIKGIYVPFWLFDADADADIRYKASRTRVWSDKDYDYRETSYYAVSRSGSLGFSGVPVDGSQKMADDLMESIEPFNLAEAVDFNTGYLAGYFADKYDVDEKQSVNRANERIKRSTEQTFASTVHGYSTVIPESSSVRLVNSHARYALYPVWILNTTWKGQKYTFAMNGQTGKFVGNLPVDKSLYFKWLFGLAGGISAVLFALSFLTELF